MNMSLRISGGVPTLGRLLAFLCLLCILAPLTAYAQDAACDQEVTLESFRKIGKARARQLQLGLNEIYKDHPDYVGTYDSHGRPLSDGVVGSVTLSWLKRFCGDFKLVSAPNFPSELASALLHFAAIAKAHPDWKEILMSPDFERWINEQDEPQRTEIYKIRRSGTTRQVISVLDLYRRGTPGKSPGTPAAGSQTEGLGVSYRLIEDDFKMLRLKDEIMQRLETLAGENYANLKAMEGAVSAAVKGLVDKPELLLPLVEKFADRHVSYQLTANSFQKLKAANIPDYILLPAETVKNQEYSTTEALNGALLQIDREVGEQMRQYKPLVLKYVQTSPGPMLTEQSLQDMRQALKGDFIAEALIDRLSQFADQKFLFNLEVDAAVDKAIKELIDQFARFLPQIVGQAEASTRYALTSQSLKALRDNRASAALPPTLIELLQGVKDVEYPTETLFVAAARARIDSLADQYKGAIQEYVDRQGITTLTDQAFKDLQKTVPEAVLGVFTFLRGQSFADRKALSAAVDLQFEQILERYKDYQPAVVAQARKLHSFDPARQIRLDGGSCGCVLRHLSGDVYGFYPFWLAGDQQQVDFSVLSRLAYYGLSFDDRGELLDDTDFQSLNREFIEVAHKHRTRVDWVIHRGDWATWRQFNIEKKGYALGRLAETIAHEVLNTEQDGFLAGLKRYLSLGTSAVPELADGLVIYFEGYPQDDDSVNVFNDFIKTLKDRLSKDGRSHTIGILLPSAELGSGVYQYQNLIRLIELATDNGEPNDIRIRFLVFIEESTHQTKKALRQAIENGLRGEQRREVLRTIVPVIEYDGRDVQKLTDDVIYFEDNFGGIGFWPLTFGSSGAKAASKDDAAPQAVVSAPGGAQTVAKLLTDEFQSANAKPVLSACKLVCPNRWAFRIAFDIFVALLALSLGLCWAGCECRTRLYRHYLIYLLSLPLPTILLGFALLTCDPYLARVSEGNGPLILLIVGVIGYSVWNYLKSKRQAEKP